MTPAEPLSSPQKKFDIFLPSPDLAGTVKYYWKMDDPNLNELHKKSQISPSGYPELIFQFGDPVIVDFNKNAKEAAPVAMVAGQIAQSISLEFSSSINCFCVKLMPYALRSIFNIDSSEFTNRTTDMSNIIPSVYPGLYDQLQNSRKDLERIEIIENFLRRSLKKNKSCVYPLSVHFINEINSHPYKSFQSIMDATSLSRRTLERKIKNEIGLSPKKLHRIVRFNKAYSAIKNNPGMRFQDVVFYYGYYDLSHFVNEFNEFSGSSPSQYFRNEDIFNPFFAGII